MTRRIGVDIGGTNLRAALVEPDGSIHDVHRQKNDDHSVDGLARAVAAAIAELDGADGDVSVGVGIAGSVRAAEGVVVNAPQLGWTEAPFGAALENALGRPVRLVNDLSAICYGEARVGAGHGARDVACLAVGTGVGLGVVADGRVLEGAAGLASEFGHVRIDFAPGARRCNCGLEGCIEAYLAGVHLPARLRETAEETGLHSELLDDRSLTATEIEAAAVAGDPLARALWDDCARRLAWAMGSVLMTFNPAVLVLGGGVLNASPSLVADARVLLLEYAWPSFLENAAVRPSDLGDDAGIVGAALLADEKRPRNR